ncbi:hypothetical protein Tco_1522489 [Tanacetum coccineum]
MSARDKARLGYGNQMNKGVLSYENEVFQSVFVSRTSDIEDSLVNDSYEEGMHAVPPPMIGIYIPSRPNKEIDESQFTYGLKQSKPSESDARSIDFNTCDSNCKEETHKSMPEPVVNEPKVVSQLKVWDDAPIIERIKHVKTTRQKVKEQNTCSQIPKPDKKDCSSLMAEKLGYNWRHIRHYWNKVSKYNGGSSFRNCIPFKDLLGRPKPKKAWVPQRTKGLLIVDVPGT